ncbi:hypothetical protein FHG66_00400 [Rubellimicrobium rubrum]|uniref:C-type lysozyme inhibitor domain-containing protein n=1 Tax=Rubellimicrobium rubrum TaxID=2585369 RepID=A0A5C4N947_9RHOB|nr:MliC family protein [Rubellimicrobium rubrum]TNC52792.1 hypothetical protein FHG66_00400 [Rubellimicrobium rubrum]
MRRSVPALLLISAVAACEAIPAPTGAPRPGSASAPSPSEVAAASIPPLRDAVTYLCADGRVVQAEYPENDDPVGGNSARLVIDGQSVRMVQGVSASGVRYIGGGLQWWTRGLRTATLAPLAAGESLASVPGTECRSGG